jgi:hypothetical protein
MTFGLEAMQPSASNCASREQDRGEMRACKDNVGNSDERHQE